MGITDRLKDKLANLGPPAPQAPSTAPARTGAEVVMERGFRARVEEAEAHALKLEEKLASQDAFIAELSAKGRLGEPIDIDAALIDRSSIYNRSPKSLDPTRSQDLAALIPMIEATAGNVQPGLVRPKGDRYEIVFGERRLAACRHLNLPFRANVADITDAELICTRAAENQGRVDPSVWALTRQFAAAKNLPVTGQRERAISQFKFSRMHLWRIERIASLPLQVEEAHPNIDAVGRRELMSMVEYFEKRPAAFNKALAACSATTLSVDEANRLLTGQPPPHIRTKTNQLVLGAKGLKLKLQCTPEQSQAIAARILSIARDLGVQIDATGIDSTH